MRIWFVYIGTWPAATRVLSRGRERTLGTRLIFLMAMLYACHSHLDRRYKVQKKIVRIMTFKEYNHSSKPLFDDLKMLNRSYQINFYAIVIIRNQFKNNILPNSLKSIFETNEDVHVYNFYTRSTKKPLIKTNLKKLSISYKGVDICNNLPSDLKRIQFQLSPKRKLKGFILTTDQI